MKRIHFDIIDSTNDYAKKHLNSLTEGTMIDASFQTNGRGRLNRHWESNKDNNILVSFILKPIIKASLLQQLSQVIAKSIMDLLWNDYNLESKVKWPNDIYIGNKKIAGILIETVLSKDGLTGVVVGIGLNVFSNNGIDTATSLNQHLDIKDSLDTILFNLRKYLLFNYNQWITIGYQQILDFCNEKSYLKNRVININGKKFKVNYLNHDGYIQMIDEIGEKSYLLVNELSLHNQLNK